MRMQLKVLNAIIISILVLGLAGCGARKGANGNIIGVEDNQRFYGTDISPQEEKNLLAKHTYHFALDSYDVNDEDTLSVYAHAKKLINHRNMRVRVEGHTDERGSREYNVALGERRANAIANILVLKGVPQEQIAVVSYGKEKPVAFGHNESAWRQNRRAVIVYEVE